MYRILLYCSSYYLLGQFAVRLHREVKKLCSMKSQTRRRIIELVGVYLTSTHHHLHNIDMKMKI